MEESSIRQIVGKKSEELIAICESFTRSSSSSKVVEIELFVFLLNLGLELIKSIFQEKIFNYEMGHILKESQRGSVNKGESKRNYVTIFGKMELIRTSYWLKGVGKFHPSDDYLELPHGHHWSYHLQEIVGSSACDNDYRASVEVCNKLLNLELSWKSSERNVGYLGKNVDEYYESKEPIVEQSAVCFSASFDGKGVTKVVEIKKEEGVNPKRRLGRGEKLSTMEMATVSVVSSFAPKVRTTAAIVDSLMGTVENKEINNGVAKKQSENDNSWHKNIHRRGHLGQQKKSIEYGINQIKQRMVNPNSRFVIPIDAGAGLEPKILECVREMGLENQFDGIILDIIHVNEYIWEAATAILGEKSKFKSKWVRTVLTDLLESKTDKVIKGLELTRDKGDFSDSKKKRIQTTITYFTNHKHKMDYKYFLGKGYPISSALVESACGHLVKERMEQSGMRWSSVGAQNILDLRAVKINGDLEDFMKFVSKNQHGDGYKAAA